MNCQAMALLLLGLNNSFSLTKLSLWFLVDYVFLLCYLFEQFQKKQYERQYYYRDKPGI